MIEYHNKCPKRRYNFPSYTLKKEEFDSVEISFDMIQTDLQKSMNEFIKVVLYLYECQLFSFVNKKLMKW